MMTGDQLKLTTICWDRPLSPHCCPVCVIASFVSDNAHTLLLFQSGDAKQRSYFYEDAMKRPSLVLCHAKLCYNTRGRKKGWTVEESSVQLFCCLKVENDLDPFGYSVPEGILAHTGINVDGEIEIKYIFGGGL